MFTGTYSPGNPWSLCMHKKYTVVCTEKQDIACLQMVDAEFCICKLFCGHISLLRASWMLKYGYYFIGVVSDIWGK